MLEQLKKLRHTEGVTHRLSHSDSAASKYPADFRLPMEVHDHSFCFVQEKGIAIGVTVTRVTLDPSHTHGVTPFSGTPLVECLRECFEVLHSEVRGTRHALLIHGVRHYAGGPTCWPRKTTLGQYAPRVQAAAFVLDECLPDQRESVLIVPNRHKACVPKWVWHSLAGDLLIAADRKSAAGKPPPPPTHI